MKSRLFFIYPEYGKVDDAQNFDICLIKTSAKNGIHEDISSEFDSVPCLPDETDLKKVKRPFFELKYLEKDLPMTHKFIFKEHGSACWVAGWGQSQSHGVSSDALKSIGVNLFDHEYCYKHR